MNHALATLLCASLIAAAACDDASSCTTEDDCFRGEICTAQGKCAKPAPDMSAPDADMPQDMPQDLAPDLEADQAPDLAPDMELDMAQDSPLLAVAAGAAHTCAIKGGALYCWGDNAKGQLGDGGNTARHTPRLVPGMASGVTAVAAGEAHTCAIQSERIYCWGDHSSGQLGIGEPNTSSSNTPRAVTLDASPVAVTAGARHTCALTVEGIALCWGDNTYGQLGVGMISAPLTQPTGAALGRSVEVRAGARHTCAITLTSQLHCWGQGGQGRLGNGTTDDQPTPQAVLSDATAVAPGGAHTCAVAADKLHCWGDPSAGQLGVAMPPAAVYSPLALDRFPGVVAVAAGAAHTCAVADNTISCWGDNKEGQAGQDLGSAKVSQPLVVPGLGALPLAIAAGDLHTCAIVDDKLSCWGDNSSGQLGVAGPSSSSEPITVLLP